MMKISAVYGVIFLLFGLLANIVTPCNKKHCEGLQEGQHKNPKIAGLLSNVNSPASALNSGLSGSTCMTDENDVKPRTRTYFWTNGYLSSMGLSNFILAGEGAQPTESSPTAVNNAENCFNRMIKHIQDGTNEQPLEDAITTLRGYLQVMKRLRLDAATYCPECLLSEGRKGPCLQTCQPTFQARLIALYEQIKADHDRVLNPATELWAAYFNREFCNIKFTIASLIIGVFKGTAPKDYKLYKKLRRQNAKECLFSTYFKVDKGVQTGNNQMKTPFTRSIVWRDLQPWMDSVADYIRKPKCKKDDRLPHPKQPYHGSKFLLRNTFRASNTSKDEWFSCHGEECGWSACPEQGPVYNDTGRNVVWQKCPADVFTIYHENLGKKIRPIVVNDEVSLLNMYEFTIYWNYKDVDNCEMRKALQYLSLTNSKKIEGKRGRFRLAAWDWLGRRRENGEPILDRDWVVFMPHEDALPDHRKLSIGEGLFYIEGMIMIASR